MNPTVMLLALVGLIGTHAGAYWYGQHVESAEQAQDRVRAVSEALADAKTQADADRARAVALARRSAAAETRLQQTRTRVIYAPQPDCVVPADYRLHLAELVAAANADTPPAGRLPDAVPAGAGTTGE